jgi:hypothetical protein
VEKALESLFKRRVLLKSFIKRKNREVVSEAERMNAEERNGECWGNKKEEHRKWSETEKEE